MIYVSLRSNFWFLVDDRDIGTVAPDLIIKMITMMIIKMITMMIMKVVVGTIIVIMTSPPSWSYL